ncbi:MAG: hypothetical protein JWM80_5185 [Cyanobacteria bacterium RYN_339]|nr:hypothetical protein [Cyanobacteria bacterium RYN_339]
MKRLALALATSMLASGCIYLTPPTGLRFGTHDKEFKDTGSAADGQAIAMSELRSPDFRVIYPDIWQVIPPTNLVSQRDGKTIKRVSIGQIASNGDAEGLQVTNLLTALDPDPGKNLTALGATVMSSLKAGVKDDFKVITNEPATMGGEPAIKVELAGTGLDEVDPTTGQNYQGKPQHFLAYCSWHKGRAYIFVISTLESRWTSLSQLFEGMAKEFNYLEGAAPVVCAVTVSPSPVASAAAAAAADKGSTPAASPTPQIAYVVCDPAASGATKPDATGTGAAKPDATGTAAASPAPSPSPTPGK